MQARPLGTSDVKVSSTIFGAWAIGGWTVHQPGITAALVGARNAEQASHNAGALNFTLSDHELAEIRKAFDRTSKELNA